MRDYLCIGVLKSDGATVAVMDCAHAGTWTYSPDKKRMRHNVSGKCLALDGDDGGFRALVKKCSNQVCSPPTHFYLIYVFLGFLSNICPELYRS